MGLIQLNMYNLYYFYKSNIKVIIYKTKTPIYL